METKRNIEKALEKLQEPKGITKPVNYTAKLIDMLFKGYSPSLMAEKLGLTIAEIYDILQNPQFAQIMHNVITSLLPSIENKVIETMHELIDNIKEDILSAHDIPIREKIQASSLFFNLFSKLLDVSLKVQAKNQMANPTDSTLDKLIKLTRELKANENEENVIEAKVIDSDLDSIAQKILQAHGENTDD